MEKHKATIIFTGTTAPRSDGFIQYLVYAKNNDDRFNMPKVRIVQGVAPTLEAANVEIQRCFYIANKKAEEANNGRRKTQG